MDANAALRIWGLCHQLRLDEDDSKLTKSARRRDRIELIRRERDMLVSFYSQYTERGQLTPKAKERVKSVKDRCEREIQRIRKLGFSAPVVSTADCYVRGTKATKPQINPESGVALVFILVDDYLARRPSQRALAWSVYVFGRSVRSFRFGDDSEQAGYCGSGRTAERRHRLLKGRLDTLFDQWENM